MSENVKIMNCPNCGLVKSDQVYQGSIRTWDVEKNKHYVESYKVCLKCREQFPEVITKEAKTK